MTNNTKIIKDPVGRRVSRISQACDRCRIKKIKCNGALPSCANCSKIGYLCKTSDKLTRRSFPKGYTENLEKDIVALQNENLKLVTYIKENMQKASSNDSKYMPVVATDSDISKELHMFRVVDNIALGSEWYSKTLQEMLIDRFPSVCGTRTAASNSTNDTTCFTSLESLTDSVDSKFEYLFSSNSHNKNNFKIVQLLITTYLNSLSVSKSNDTIVLQDKHHEDISINKKHEEMSEVTLPIISNPEQFLPLTANFKNSNLSKVNLSYFANNYDSLASNHYLMLLKRKSILFKIQLLFILYIANINYSVILNNDNSTEPVSQESSYGASTSFFKLNYDFAYLSSIIFDAPLPTLKWSNNVSYLQCLLLYLQIALSRSEASSFEFSKKSDYSNSNVDMLQKCTKVASIIYSIFLQSSLICPAKLFAVTSNSNKAYVNKNLDEKKKGYKKQKKDLELDQSTLIEKTESELVDNLTYIDMLNLYWSFFILCSTLQIRIGCRMSSASPLVPFLSYHYSTNYSCSRRDGPEYSSDEPNDSFIDHLNNSHSKIPKDTLLATPLLRLIELFDIINLFDIFKERSLSKRSATQRISHSKQLTAVEESEFGENNIQEKVENLTCLSEILQKRWYQKHNDAEETKANDNPAVLLLYFQLQMLISFRINKFVEYSVNNEKSDLIPFYKGYLTSLIELDLINNKSIHDNNTSAKFSHTNSESQQSIHNNRLRRHSTAEGMTHEKNFNGGGLQRSSIRNDDDIRKGKCFYNVRSIESEFILNVLTKNKSQNFKKKVSTMLCSSLEHTSDSNSISAILKNISMVQLFRCLNSIIGSSTSPTSSSFKVGFIKLPVLAEIPEFTFLAIKGLIDDEYGKNNQSSEKETTDTLNDENLNLIVRSMVSLFKNYRLYMKASKNHNGNAMADTNLMEMFKAIESHFKVSLSENSAVSSMSDCDIDINGPLSLLNSSDLSVNTSSLFKKSNRSRSNNEVDTPSSRFNILDNASYSKLGAFSFSNFSSNESKDFNSFNDRNNTGLSLSNIPLPATNKNIFHSIANDDLSMKRSISVSIPPHTSNMVSEGSDSIESNSNHNSSNLFESFYNLKDPYNHNENDSASDGNGTAAYYVQQKKSSSPFNLGTSAREFSTELPDKSGNEEKRDSLFSWRKKNVRLNNNNSVIEAKDIECLNKRSKSADEKDLNINEGSNFKKMKPNSNVFEVNHISDATHSNIVDNLKNLVNFEHVEFADSEDRSNRNESSQYQEKSELKHDGHTNYQLSEIKKKFNDFNLILQ